MYQVLTIRIKGKKKRILKEFMETVFSLRIKLFRFLSRLADESHLPIFFNTYKLEKFFARNPKVDKLDYDLYSFIERHYYTEWWKLLYELRQLPQMVVYGLVRQWVQAFKSCITKRKQGLKASLPGVRKPNSIAIDIDGLLLEVDNSLVTLKLSRCLKLHWKIPDNIENVTSCQIVYFRYIDELELRIRYQIQPESANVSLQNWLSIDLGVNNLVSAISNTGPSFIISSGWITSLLNWAYDKISISQSFGFEKMRKRIYAYLKRRIHTNLHQLTSKIIEYCLQYSIGVIFIGQNVIDSIRNSKQNKSISKQLRWILGKLPFGKFVQMLKAKAEKFGIQVQLVNESYTSKASALDDEPIKQETYSIKRIQRGLVKSDKNEVWNADLNACLNIAKKAKVLSSTEVKQNRHFWLRKLSNTLKFTFGKLLKYSWCNQPYWLVASS